MAPRLDLQALLVDLLGSDSVYFQPPTNVKMTYPCIVYSRSRIETDFADNHPYSQKKRYEVTVIYNNPDDDLPDRVSLIPTCVHERNFTADNLYHDVFNLYF